MEEKSAGIGAENQVIRINGTLDAIAYYMTKEWGYAPEEAAKVTALLWLEQVANDDSGSPLVSASTPGLKLEDFAIEGQPAKGMVSTSRAALNFSKADADIRKLIPSEVAQWLTSNDHWSIRLGRSVLHLLLAVLPNFQLIPDGLACVCMRAWICVGEKSHVPFQVEQIMPSRESSQDENSRLVCDLMGDDGRAHIGHASWECPSHKEGNYCVLTREAAISMLNKLVELSVLKKVDDQTSAFL